MIAIGYFAFDRLAPKPAVPGAGAPVNAASTVAASFHPPPHSIAVLPFVNMSGDASQSYFSDGLTEELLNSLSRINELQVAARTSSFSFQGEHPDIATVAHKLNVAAVLEGSVRRSAHTVRITAQLVNGSTGYRLWSQTYDRDLGDVLALFARRYQEAVTAFGEVVTLEPEFTRARGFRGLAYYGLGDFQHAYSSCEDSPDYFATRWCLVLAYEKLGRHADAEARLTKWQAAGRHGKGTGVADHGRAGARPRPGVRENRSALGSPPQRAALPGDRAGVEFPD